jgi:hypothetical protein
MSLKRAAASATGERGQAIMHGHVSVSRIFAAALTLVPSGAHRWPVVVSIDRLVDRLFVHLFICSFIHLFVFLFD